MSCWAPCTIPGNAVAGLAATFFRPDPVSRYEAVYHLSSLSEENASADGIIICVKPVVADAPGVSSAFVMGTYYISHRTVLQ